MIRKIVINAGEAPPVEMKMSGSQLLVVSARSDRADERRAQPADTKHDNSGTRRQYSTQVVVVCGCGDDAVVLVMLQVQLSARLMNIN